MRHCLLYRPTVHNGMVALLTTCSPPSPPSRHGRQRTARDGGSLTSHDCFVTALDRYVQLASLEVGAMRGWSASRSHLAGEGVSGQRVRRSRVWN